MQDAIRHRAVTLGNEEYNKAVTQQTMELLQKALALPPEERTALVRSLMESLEGPVDADSELAWNQEIARRVEDLDSGKAETVSWGEIRQRTSARLADDK